MALYLLTEALESNALGFYSEGLLVFAQSLLESFAKKCERENDFGDWVDLFDRATKITEICGEKFRREIQRTINRIKSPSICATVEIFCYNTIN